MKIKDEILIAGGGIGGLTTALALAKAGWRSHVLESHSVFSETGAGIELTPNAARVLIGLGVEKHIEPAIFKPEKIKIFNALTGRLLSALPLTNKFEERFGAPYWVLHRADLQAALVASVKDQPDIRITTDFHVEDFEQDSNGVRVQGSNDKIISGPALIGADGIWSTIRSSLFSNSRLKFTGQSASRGLIGTEEVESPFCDSVIGIWLAPGAQLIHYPVKAGKQINVVAVIEDDWLDTGWNKESDPEELFYRFNYCVPEILGLLQLIKGWRKWSLYELDPLPNFSSKYVTLVGDAAHPVLPFLSQGGALAIEDAAVISGALIEVNGDYEQAWQTYERIRKDRVARVQAASKRNGQIYNMSAPMRWIRNIILNNYTTDRLLKRFDWLFDNEQTLNSSSDK